MNAVLAIGGPRALWYATRGTGVVSLILLTAIVCLGIAGVRRLRSERCPRFLVVGLHRNLTLLALAFLALHIATSVLDSFAPVKLLDAFVPFVSAYRPLWLGLGAVAFDLLLALTITSLLRARIGHRTWRALHWLAYAAWPVALVHALGTGSDARVGWMQILAVTATAIVVASIFVRLADGRAWTGERLAAAGAALLVPAGVLAWYVQGPGDHGWAARAGTPSALLARPSQASAASTTTTPVASGGGASLPRPPFTATLRGRLTSTQSPGGLVLVDIKGRTRHADGLLWIRLQGQPVGNGGVAMTSSGASYGPPSAPRQYLGKIVSLQGTRLVLALRGAPGRLALRVDLRIDGVSHLVTGTVAALSGGAP